MVNLKPLALVALVALLSACGGGGGGGGGGNDSGAGASTGSGNSSTGSMAGQTRQNSSSGSGSTGTGSQPTTPTAPAIEPQTITLSWTSPSTREDGSALPLSELAGYRIFYFLEESPEVDTIVPVNGGTTRSAQLTLTAAGTYHIAIAAIDQNGLVSTLSNYVSLAVN